MPTSNILYAGIGSRETPSEVLAMMVTLGRFLAGKGFVLRSGHAPGADQAFEEGCDQAHGAKEIWMPWQGFNGASGPGHLPTPQMFEIAGHTHPAWQACSPAARRLHARNVGQVLGEDCATPVSFVVCYTKDGCQTHAARTRGTGGTGTAITLADRAGVPVFNLARPDALERLAQHIGIELPRFSEKESSGKLPAAPRAAPAPTRDSYPFATHPDGARPAADEVFVFGSNLAGRHGAAAAKLAQEQYGAEPGVGFGFRGDSFAIPTKDGRMNKDLDDPTAALPLAEIQSYANAFISFASKHPEIRFFLTRVGCGLAGYKDETVAPLFFRAKTLGNVSVPAPWAPYLEGAAHTPNFIAKHINIASNEAGLGGMLTNPTELAAAKGNIHERFPVWVAGTEYRDVETAYKTVVKHGGKVFDVAEVDDRMATLIAMKFLLHPGLESQVARRGGTTWLSSCTHFVGAIAKGKSAQTWEGRGMDSRFIRCLATGFANARLHCDEVLERNGDPDYWGIEHPQEKDRERTSQASLF